MWTIIVLQSFTKVVFIWHKARSMGHPVRTGFANNGLLKGSLTIISLAQSVGDVEYAETILFKTIYLSANKWLFLLKVSYLP